MTTSCSIVCTSKWGLCCQKQVSQAWISNYMPQWTVECNYLFLPDIPFSDNKVLKWPSGTFNLKFSSGHHGGFCNSNFPKVIWWWGSDSRSFPRSAPVRFNWFNSLAPGKFEWNCRYLIFQIISVIDGWGISCELALRWMPLNLTDYKST